MTLVRIAIRPSYDIVRGVWTGFLVCWVGRLVCCGSWAFAAPASSVCYCKLAAVNCACWRKSIDRDRISCLICLQSKRRSPLRWNHSIRLPDFCSGYYSCPSIRLCRKRGSSNILIAALHCNCVAFVTACSS